MSRLYALLATLGYPFIRLWLQRRVLAEKEDPARLPERLGHLAFARPAGKVIWIHGASVGETLSVLPLIKQLQEADDAPHIVLTSGTVSSTKLIASKLPERALHHYLPIDVPFVVRRFLKALRPDIAIWIESEFWPNMLRETKHQNIPMLLVNARLSARSMKRWQLFGGSFRRLMRCFDTIYAGSQKDKQRLHALGVPRVEWAGNLKYDAPPLATDPKLTGEILDKIGDRRLWLAASTHAGEEEHVIAVHRALRDVFPDILTVIVPRHPKRAEQIGELLANAKLTYARRSEKQVILPETDVYLADTLGELGIFYRMAGVCFVGGSLIAHGGHNPIEPAQLDCAIVCGPHMESFSNIVGEMKTAGAIVQLEDADALSEQVIELLRDQDRQAAMAERAHFAVDEKRGASELIAARILQRLAVVSQRDASQTEGN